MFVMHVASELPIITDKEIQYNIPIILWL